MKEFKSTINYEEIAVEDVNGEKHVIKVLPMTINTLRLMEDLQKNFQDKKIGSSDLIVHTCILAFGQTQKFWEQFDINTLGQLNTYASKLMNGDVKKK